MTERNEPEFQLALKEFDNKNYEKVKKLCEKLTEKNPKDDKALALKGLNYFHLNNLEEAEKSLKQALKANIKSGVAWHFYAIFYKERGEYTRAMNAYNQALKNAPTNFNIIRDLSYMQLYLRQLNSFVETCRKGIDLKPSALINWVSFAFACSLIKNYDSAIAALNTAENTSFSVMNKNEMHETKIFKAFLLNKMGNFKEAMEFLIKNEKSFIDKDLVYKMIINNAYKSKNYEKGIDYCIKSLRINYDNIDTLCAYFNMKINEDDFNMTKYDDFLSLKEDFKYQEKLISVLGEVKNMFPKSKILSKFELAFNQGEEFKKKFEEYFIKQVEITIPSFYINVKFIYQFQQYKLKYIQEILDKYLDNINKDKKVNDKLFIPVNISWVYFYASEHYLFLGDLEKAINYINLAIDLTPSVVELYMVTAKIFKHSYMMEEYISAYDKARLLDVGDRYLNAKMAKIHCRNGEIHKSIDTMKEFVGEPLTEESITSYQNLWYLNECGCCYLQKYNILRSHYLFHNIIDSFIIIIQDQVDFYNFCLRRYMLKDLYHTIIYFDNMSKNRYITLALSKLDLIYCYLKSNENNKELEESLKKEYEELLKDNDNNLKYNFKTIKDLLNMIEKDFYFMLVKLQKISNVKEIHFLCVKYFLIKQKTLMALKSIKFLSNNKSDFFYVQSILLMKKYIEEKKSNINEIIMNKINEIIKDAAELSYKEENPINLMKYKLYEKGNFTFNDDNENIINDLFKSFDTLSLRKLPNEKINDFISYIALFTNYKGICNVKNKLLEKMQLVNVDKKEISRNLRFYEDKKFN